LWIGDPAEIQAKRVKKLKTDRKDEIAVDLNDSAGASSSFIEDVL
jgi:hypothetical protein